MRTVTIHKSQASLSLCRRSHLMTLESGTKTTASLSSAPAQRAPGTTSPFATRSTRSLPLWMPAQCMAARTRWPGGCATSPTSSGCWLSIPASKTMAGPCCPLTTYMTTLASSPTALPAFLVSWQVSLGSGLECHRGVVLEPICEQLVDVRRDTGLTIVLV